MTTARAAGLIACHGCGVVHRPTVAHCVRCGGALHSRTPKSLQRTLAWLVAGMIAYIPANTYPMLLTSTLLEKHENTIVGGVVDLVDHGSYGIALIVFVASVVIPISKFLTIGYLTLTVVQHRSMSRHQRHRMLEMTEFIGR